MNDPIVTGVLFTCVLLLIIGAVEHYFRKSIIPALCWVMLAGALYGLGYAAYPSILPRLSLEPEAVLYIFLPILIFDSARKLKATDLWCEKLPIGFFASIGVVLTMVLIGIPFAWMANLPRADALLFGAVLAATDPVAVSAIFGNFKFPSRLKTIVEGESLLNDGTAVVLFSIVISNVIHGQSVSWLGGTGQVLISILGAVAVGILCGWTGAWFIRIWHALHDRFIGALLPLIFIYSAFALADHFLHVSGVIATMAATLTLFHTRFRHAKKTTKQAELSHHLDQFFDKFWDFLNNLANAILFFVLGAELGQHDFLPYLRVVPWVILVLYLARSVTVYAGSWIIRAVGHRLPLLWQHTLNIAGLKGALSAALMLMLPADYEHRDAFIAFAFVLIVFTMVANSVAMQCYLKRVHLPQA